MSLLRERSRCIVNTFEFVDELKNAVKLAEDFHFGRYEVNDASIGILKEQMKRVQDNLLTLKEHCNIDINAELQFSTALITEIDQQRFAYIKRQLEILGEKVKNKLKDVPCEVERNKR